MGFRPGLDSTLVPLLCAQSYDETAQVFSPDGRFLAYVSDESGRHEVYVRPFPDVESGRWSVSSDGGHSPLWAHAGGELFYLTPDNQMIAAVVETSPTFRVRDRDVLFGLGPGYILSPSELTAYDVTPDDQRFLMVRSVQDPRSASVRMILVQNFFEELKQKVGQGND